MKSKPAIVLIDAVTDWKHVIDAAKSLEFVIIAIQLPAEELPAKFRTFLPTKSALADAGVDYIISVDQRDVFLITQRLQILAADADLKLMGVIPLSEIAVEVSDCVASCLSLPHNRLDRVTARRDKGLMKNTVESSGLRIAKYARVASLQDVRDKMQSLSLNYPIVLKTPAGMSSTDVFICSNYDDANKALVSILGKNGPDGRNVERALLEEYIGGVEFAINLIAFTDGDNTTPRMLVTDVWKYQKSSKARYGQAEICLPSDHPTLLAYACSVAKAVGIRYGAAHVEVKAEEQLDDNGSIFTNPCLIEVGARLSGGRKSILTMSAVEKWNPFQALIQAHCGETCEVPQHINYLTPNKFARHIFLPIEKRGCIEKIELDTSSLTTLHSSALIVKPGDTVEETTDIISCAGFVWLLGNNKEQVDADTYTLMSSVVISVI